MGRLVIDLPNIKQFADGRVYFRRKVGQKDTYHRLPALDDPDFRTEYGRLAAGSTVSRPEVIPGSLHALVIDYRASSEYTNIEAADTKANYARYLDMIVAEHGHRSVKGVTPTKVRKMRDAYADKPGKANNWLSVFKTLMAWGSQNDWRGDNPASGIKPLKIGEYEPWPVDLLQVCFAVATPMTRLLLAIGLCTGQRNSDVIRMQYGWITDNIMSFRQQKTKVEVSIPVHPLLWDELARLPRKSVTLAYDRSGKPFGTTGAVQSRIRDLMAQPEVEAVVEDLIARESVPPGTTFVFHGLRKNACCYLLEMGESDASIGAMLGMSPKMVRHYGKRARALMIARGAAERVTGGTVLALPGVRLDKQAQNA